MTKFVDILNFIKEIIAEDAKMTKFREIVADIKELISDIKNVIDSFKEKDV